MMVHIALHIITILCCHQRVSGAHQQYSSKKDAAKKNTAYMMAGGLTIKPTE